MKKYLVILTVLLLAYSCQPPRHGQSFLNEDGNLSIQLDFENLSNPLIISGDQGAFYFETKDGRNWIKELPDQQTWTDSSYLAKWNLEEAEVQLLVEVNADSYHLSLNSDAEVDILKWGLGLNASDDEYFTGLFERAVDGNQTESWKEGIQTAMNLRGEAVDMLIKPTLSLYTPFYLSSNNYGMFVEGTWPGHYDFCKTNEDMVLIEFEGPSFSAVFYTADNPATIVQQHSLAVGPTLVPPKWAFEPWRWRDNHEHKQTYYDGTEVKAPYNSQLVEDILMMEAFGIPCGVYWVDRPWAKGVYGYADFEWDPQRFPEAKAMLNWLGERDVKFMLWIAPWVAGDMQQVAHEKGYSVPMKGPAGGIDPDSAALIDFTNPEACKWWQENGPEKMLKQGVAGFKLDRSEELVPETRDVLFADGRSAREVRNDYPVLYAKTVHESAKKIHGDDFALLTRAGYTGSSKYTSFWGGDIGSPQEGLRAAIIALLRSSVIGYPVWGSDIGGYWQGDLDREVFARWLAFGCFNPIMEVGPTEDLAPWSMDSEPGYDEELIAIWRVYARLHSDLADYSHQYAVEANETGMPIVRPLFLHFPEQSDAWSDWQTFLYGEDILVSAIWQKGVELHRMYLPAGERWVDAWNPGDVFEGGQWIEVESPMYKIPLFIREGAQTELGNIQQLYEESLQISQKKPDLFVLEKEAF
ncbi:alpha-D-xyloside xylohydrolase [Marinilabilia salmonicolor]|jgi:alpha-glucosidase (family GH31 glycosyl hydrolase)|uniref:glycoside hydrolase family 31 protein n=1 Tax=Marinilabilia salmonicolor TaxID=989 RepID=UPI000D077888|nr:TIM-barrel domain-containing protein [Marinilabilia salmonicolor]PRY97818.1 alpha-D-xyloside xylohydrolase [Marinilabilia salmonicolor]